MPALITFIGALFCFASPNCSFSTLFRAFWDTVWLTCKDGHALSGSNSNKHPITMHVLLHFVHQCKKPIILGHPIIAVTKFKQKLLPFMYSGTSHHQGGPKLTTPPFSNFNSCKLSTQKFLTQDPTRLSQLFESSPFSALRGVLFAFQKI